MIHRTVWRTATIKDILQETPDVKSFILLADGFDCFKPGQHVDIRLTAPDGYQAQRSYSISAQGNYKNSIRITVELLKDGEVSSFMHAAAQVDDTIEIRGPFGGPFTWTGAEDIPILFIAGGSGIAPIMAMLLHRNKVKPKAPATLIYSSRTEERIIFKNDISHLENYGYNPPKVIHTLTRSHSSNWQGCTGRITQSMVEQELRVLGSVIQVYVCGSTPFVESINDMLLDANVELNRIATEHFG